MVFIMFANDLHITVNYFYSKVSPHLVLGHENYDVVQNCRMEHFSSIRFNYNNVESGQ